MVNNASNGNAGAFYNDTDSLATLTISGLSDNHTIDGGYGGAMINNGQMTLINSLVSGNQTTPQTSNPVAGNAGGIWNAGGELTLINSTISNNSAWGAGGGIENDATLNIYFSTIAGNLADSYAANTKLGGGIYNIGDPVNLQTTLLAQNYAAAAASDGSGSFHSLDYNLIQNTTGMTFTGATSHNLTGLDPLINSPQNYGGRTAVRALLAGSPAIDAVPLAHCTGAFGEPLTQDQRGFPRPVNGLCDIGAFEGQQPAVGYHLNLVRNGDAEGAAGSPNPLGAFVGVPIWTSVVQLMTAVHYNTAGGFSLPRSRTTCPPITTSTFLPAALAPEPAASRSLISRPWARASMAAASAMISRPTWAEMAATTTMPKWKPISMTAAQIWCRAWCWGR